MTTTDAPSSGETSTKQQAQETAATAKDEGKHVAGVAKEQASQVASEAASQVKNVAGDAVAQVSDQLREQGGVQRDKLVATLSTLGDDLSAMADQASPGLANDLTRQVAGQARSLTSRLDGREVGDLLDEVRSFARQRPGVFLLGSLVAGVVAGRLLAGARDGIAGAEAAGVSSTPTGAESGATFGAGAEPSTPSLPLGSVADQEVTFTRNPTIGAGSPGLPTQGADYGDVPDTGYDDGLSSGGRP